VVESDKEREKREKVSVTDPFQNEARRNDEILQNFAPRNLSSLVRSRSCPRSRPCVSR
jgi:hypothetical protein